VPSPDGDTVRSVRRALDILFLLTDELPVLTLTDCARAVGLPKTTTLRLLQTLERTGVLWSDNGRYVPGPALLRWSRIASDAWLLPPGVQQVLDLAAQETGETVNVYVRKGLQRVCIAHAQGPNSLRHVVRVGDELPLWAGASAKIFLAEASDELLDDVAACSPHGPAHRATLDAWVAEVRRDGWAVSHAEREDLISAIAMRIDPAAVGGVVTALSISGPSTRFTEAKLPDLLATLRRTAARVARYNAGQLTPEPLGITRLISGEGAT
jgi:DNA-binding IclR family transcriptional regulator